jgi:hypothetical protein
MRASDLPAFARTFAWIDEPGRAAHGEPPGVIEAADVRATSPTRQAVRPSFGIAQAV